jgi:hypothetical protein
LIIVVVKFREGANPVPSRTSHNTLIEVIWTGGPVIILLFLAIPSFQLLTAQLTPPENPDLTVKAGSTVMLNALGSRDPEGDPLRYEWTQVRGNPVAVLDPNTPRATFVAPKVSAKRLLRFKLRVTDMRGPDSVKGADSLPAFVNVWIEP